MGDTIPKPRLRDFAPHHGPREIFIHLKQFISCEKRILVASSTSSNGPHFRSVLDIEFHDPCYRTQAWDKRMNER